MNSPSVCLTTFFTPSPSTHHSHPIIVFPFTSPTQPDWNILWQDLHPDWSLQAHAILFVWLLWGVSICLASFLCVHPRNTCVILYMIAFLSLFGYLTLLMNCNRWLDELWHTNQCPALLHSALPLHLYEGCTDRQASALDHISTSPNTPVPVHSSAPNDVLERQA